MTNRKVTRLDPETLQQLREVLKQYVKSSLINSSNVWQTVAQLRVGVIKVLCSAKWPYDFEIKGLDGHIRRAAKNLGNAVVTKRKRNEHHYAWWERVEDEAAEIVQRNVTPTVSSMLQASLDSASADRDRLLSMIQRTVNDLEGQVLGTAHDSDLIALLDDLSKAADDHVERCTQREGV